MEGKEIGCLAEQLKQMAAVNIRTANPDDLVDIADVNIRTDLAKEERIKDYIRQIKNPYCYRCHGVTVKISFAGKKKLEDCIRDAMLL